MAEIADSTALRYHEETKYSPEGLLASQHQLDWSKKPALHKSYHQARKTDLTVYIPFVEGTINEAVATFPLPRLAGPPYKLEHISRLLYFTNGVTRVVPHPGAPEPLMMRAAPSAGALYPTELYVAAFDVKDLESGVYNFQVRDHSLITIWEGDFRETLGRACRDDAAAAALRAAPFAVVMTGLFWRSAWRYQERAYRRILLDTGHVLGNLVLYAPRVGLRAVPIGGFVDQAVEETLLIDGADEGPLVVVPLLPATGAGADVPAPRPRALKSACVAAKGEAPDDGFMKALHAASRVEAVRPVRADEPIRATSGVPAPGGDEPRASALEGRHAFTTGVALPDATPKVELDDGVEEAIITRRSTRAFARTSMSLADLGRILDFSYGLSAHQGAAPGFIDRALVETFVVAHGVDGLDAGVYYFAPIARELRLVRSGDARERAHHFCLGQELGRDAACIVVHATDLHRAVALYGERAYRYVHLDAGHIGERLGLAALRLGLGASGIGGFFDDEVSELLALPQRSAIVYVTTIGVPQDKGTVV